MALNKETILYKSKNYVDDTFTCAAISYNERDIEEAFVAGCEWMRRHIEDKLCRIEILDADYVHDQVGNAGES